MKESTKEALACSRCRIQVETYSEIVYSRGARVCIDCKKGSQLWDNRAFDMDMELRRYAR